jgi:hypothetical protein
VKTLLMVSLLVITVSCSSVKTGDNDADALIAHMSKDKKVIGKDWDEKFTKDGFINGEYIAIGSSTNRDIDAMHRPLRVKADADATARLLRSAPTDFKRVVQSVLNSLDGDEGSVQESQIMITEVKSLTGMKSNFDDHQCVTIAIPNQNLKYNFVKECRVIVRVPASNLMRAYDYTLEKKYSIQKKNDIEALLLKEMNATVENAAVAAVITPVAGPIAPLVAPVITDLGKNKDQE